MSRLFLSYRREDTAGYSGRLADALREHFGDDVIFRDIDTMTPGNDFVDVMTKAVDDADVLLALIGRRWLTAKDSERRRRIDDPEDYVRLEIATALERGTKVIPVLVDGARLPRPQSVPEPLRPLLRLQAIELTDSRWSYDLGVLLDELRPILLRADDQAAPVAEDEGDGSRRPRRLRLGLLAVLTTLLVGGSIAGFAQDRSQPQVPPDPTSFDTPTTTGAVPSSSTSSVPETSTTVRGQTTAVGPTRTTAPPTTRPPVTPPPATSPPGTSPPATSPPGTTAPATTAPPAPSYRYDKLSGDGRYGAHKTADGNHYIVRRVSTGEMVFTTRPQYATGDHDNDIKAAHFCTRSELFAATYHYWGGTSIYSWIGYWSVTTGQLVRDQRAEGDVYNLDAYC